MLTQDKLKKLHRVLTSKISKASKKLSLNLKIKQVRESTYNKKIVYNNKKSIKKQNKTKKSNKNKKRRQNNLIDKTFQNNFSGLSDVHSKEENFNDSFKSYLTDNNFFHKNKIKNVTILKNYTKELYDKTLLLHVMKYYITKSSNNSIKFDHLHYLFKPISNFLYNSKKTIYKKSVDEKRKYINYDNNLNLTFGKNKNNNLLINELESCRIKNNKISNLHMMNNQIFNNNFIFNINNYRSNTKSAKTKSYKEILDEENTPSFNKEIKEDENKNINKKLPQKKINITKNYINIEELKLNNHILQNLIHKKKIMENTKNKKPKISNSETSRAKSLKKNISLIDEINKRIKNKYKSDNCKNK